MTALPTGTVTLLFTDIEGSTRLLERTGDTYSDILAEHRRVLRETFDRHGGVEVGTEGDSFFISFPSAIDALAAAREGQDALASREVRVRMGIHTGEPLIHEGSYVGMDVHRAARVAAAGHGGQIVLTEATRALVGSEGVRDLGIHRLKDIGELRLYQSGDDDFPPLRTVGIGSLPSPAAALVGRQAELAAVVSIVRDDATRLVTLVGPGGIGKTRLALEIGRELLDSFIDGVWFVDLGAVTDPEWFEMSVAAAVGATDELVAQLRDRHSLLILDNFEQLVGAADRLAQLIELCPGIACIVTSRQALHLRGEREFPLEPLAEDASIELFRQRARAVSPSFDANHDLLARVSDRLDHLPLAIELAAARTRVLDASQLLARLDERLPLLTGGPRDAPERQRTLRSTIEWSHDLLDEPEKRLFACLSVFVGSWSLEAAEDVAEADLDTLQALGDKSLISFEEGRFRMLGTIREFAIERLEASNAADEIRGRHARYFSDLVARAEPRLISPEQRTWLDLIEMDVDNLLAAFELLARADVEQAVAFASNLTFFWYIRGRYSSGTEWLERAVSLSEGWSSLVRVRAAWGLGLLYAIVGDGQRAGALLRESLELAREIDDASMIARSLDVLALVAFFESDLSRARETFEEAIGYARASDDRWCLADCLGTLSSIYPLIGEFDLAMEAGTEALNIARREDDRQGIRMALFGLALAQLRLGHLEPARTMAEEGLVICQEIGDRFFASYFMWILALVETDAGNIDRACSHAEDSLRIAEDLEVPLLLVCALEASAIVARKGADLDRAWQLLTRADDITESGMVPSSYGATVARRLGEIAAARGDGRASREHLERSLAIAQSVGDRWGVDRSLEQLARSS
ncbi:MAG: tetratricopeptide repeat protein [Actinomycetota bacterium]